MNYYPGLLEFGPDDFETAERIANRKGYTQTAYTSSSAVPGLFCLPDRPGHHGGVVVKLQGWGLLFVQDMEDLGMEA